MKETGEHGIGECEKAVQWARTRESAKESEPIDKDKEGWEGE